MGDENQARREARAYLQNTTLYREFQAEKNEILTHKWLESEKAGYDIGFEAALVDWVTKHRRDWRRSRQAELRKRTSEKSETDNAQNN